MADAHLRQLLKSYGLTNNQARILAILTQNKTYLSVKQVSRISNIARESIYQILFDLKEKGLIEKAITTPKKYKAIPLKRILQILHQQKTSQIYALEKLTKQVLANNNNLDNDNVKERFQYVLVPKKRKKVTRDNKHDTFPNEATSPRPLSWKKG